MKPRIFLTRRVPEAVMNLLGRRFTLSYNPKDRFLTRKELFKGVKNCEGLISMLSDPVDEELMSAAPRLRVISNYAVGTNNINLKAAANHKIRVTNTPGVLTEATADLCWALILSLGRRVVEGDKMVRGGLWTGWAPTQLVGVDLYGKTMGIIGLGRIGSAVARRARGFGMRVLYFKNKRLSAGQEKREHVSYSPLNSLISKADILSLHCPLTPLTRHMIGKNAFGRMKASALLINTARGPIVDEKALIKALRSGKIAGAGLDVYEREPALQAGLTSCKNTVLLPHLGSAGLETRIKMGLLVIDSLEAVFKNRRIPNRVK